MLTQRGTFMKSVLLTVLLVANVAAQASFDLMLIPDANGAVQRFDPVNGAYLGFFAQGSLAQAVDYSPTSKKAYIYNEPGRIYTYNHSTGERTSTLSGNATIDAFAVDSSATYGWTYIPGQSTMARYNLQGGKVDVVMPAGISSVSRIIRASANRMVAIGFNLAGDMVAFAFTGNSNSAASETVATLASASTLLAGQTIGQPANYAVDNYTFMYRNNTNELRRANFLINGSGALVSPSTTLVSTSLTFGNTVIPNLVSAHDGYYAIGASSADPTLATIAEFDGSTRFMRMIDTPIKVRSGHWTPSIVLAPEPTSLVLLATGLGMVTRRRTKRTEK